MSAQKQCIDFYGERLKVGDKVIPVLSEALIIGIGGIISKIEYNERYNNHYITITDKNGNILLENVDARCYTTEERYEERENQKYIYYLTFYNDKLYLVGSYPLTNKSNLDYEIPKNTNLVSLNAKHITQKGDCYTSYHTETIYTYFFEENIKLYCDSKNKENEQDFYYVMNNNGNWYPLSDGYKIAQSKEELQTYVKAIIKYFKDSDLSNVNSDKLFEENSQAKAFEKKLIKKLNS